MLKLIRWLVSSAIILVVLLPIISQVVWSLAFNWFFPSLLPQAWGLKAWRYVFSPSARVGEGLTTSLWIALLVVIIAMLVGLPAARALGLYNFRGKAGIEWLIMLPILVPTLVVVMGIHILFIRYGLADRWIGVVLVHLVPALPYFVLVMASVFANYNLDLEETARTLGANPVRVWWYVTLPAIRPGLMVAALFTFLVSWTQYITTLLIGGGQVVSLPMVLFPFISGSNEATAAAISLIFVAPAVLVLILTSHQLQREAAVLGGFGRL